MKIAANRVESFVRRPDPAIRAVLVYGPDEGLVRERAEALGRTVVEDLADAFRVASLPATAIAAEPARLVDEAAALSMIGGRRLIRVRGAGEAMVPAFAAFFDMLGDGDSLVVAEAGDLGKSSKLRALFENAAVGIALPCYVDDEAGLMRVVDDMLRERGFTLAEEVGSYLAHHLVGDRLVARSEIEKLVTYMGDGRRVELEDAEACVGDSAALGLEDPAWAAAEGDLAALDRALARLYGEGVSAVAVLRIAQRHFQRLQLLISRIAAGQAAEAAVAGIRPPVFFKARSRLVGEARRWTPAKVRLALERLVEAEAQCKRTGMPDETLCARTLFQLAWLVRPAR